MVTEKFCPDCGVTRPEDAFTRDRSRKDGLAAYCRAHARCRANASRAARVGTAKRRTASGRGVPSGSKWCPDCGLVRPLSEFPRTRATTSGRYTYCKPCHNARGKASKEKIGGSQTYHLKRRYGITAVEADAMPAAQGGLCAICRAAPAVHVDHDHATDVVRELLCFNCNGGLGQFRDDPAVLRAAAGYVERHRARQHRAQPLVRRRPEVISHPVGPPVGSSQRPPVHRRTGLSSRGRAVPAAREAGE
ncbi:endonuclease VII domain-containing protein [Modestobacter sp. I12A-02662]|uniref:endonuclease VII domain-containing protein n=1 Tax=Modestobacter sp. I12A-02662 TaxID=1730496 RepID=UPI0034DE9514